MKTKILILIFAVILLASAVSALTITSVTSDPKQIEPGETAEITLEIKNNLEEDVANISISLDLIGVPFTPYQSSSEETVEEIREGKKEEIRFNIMAMSDADSGIYQIPVLISYDDVSKTSYIGLIINSDPELRLDYEGNLIKGRINDLTLKIINIGLSEVKLLSLEVEDTVGLNLVGSKYVYIGDIDSDDFDSADFKARISENAGSSIILPVKLTYRDALNTLKQETREVKLRVYSEEEAIRVGLIQKSYTLYIIIVILAVIILYIIYKKVKKARRRRKEKEE